MSEYYLHTGPGFDASGNAFVAVSDAHPLPTSGGTTTLANIQAIADQTILGNVSGGVLHPAALSAGQVRTMLGLAAVATTGAHSDLTGLTTGDPHTQYANVNGRAGGQTITGGTGSGDGLTLTATSHSTKGAVSVTGSQNANTTFAIVNATTGTLAAANMNLSISGAMTLDLYLLSSAFTTVGLLTASTAVLTSGASVTGGILWQTATTAPITWATNGTVRGQLTGAGIWKIGSTLTNPTLTVDGTVASCVTGISITGAASGGGVTLAATGGTNEALTLASKGSGNLILTAGTSGLVNIIGTTGNLLAVDNYSATASTGPGFFLRRFRGSSGSPAIVQDGDRLAAFLAQGANTGGTVTNTSAGFFVEVDGAPGTNVPGRLKFTTSTVSGAVDVVRLTIDSVGLITIASGGVLKLGNAATTGLTAGVLAATTNASIVISDSTGQAYRIPCII